MNELQKSFIESSSPFLMHYNHNHDKLGRFTSSNGSTNRRISYEEIYDYLEKNLKGKKRDRLDEYHAIMANAWRPRSKRKEDKIFKFINKAEKKAEKAIRKNIEKEEKNRKALNTSPNKMDAAKKQKKLESLNKELNTFDYGVVIDGKKHTDLDSVDWTKYKTMSIDDIQKNRCGICWDFVNYQHQQFKKAGIKDESYFYIKQLSKDPQDIVTHTFSIADGGNGQEKWVESSWSKHKGVHDVDSYKDVVKTLNDNYKSDYPSEVYMYDPDKTIGVSNQDFFKEVTKRRIQ